jgi:hypothetical protein
MNQINQIKEGTKFQHKGGGKYDFLTILHPASDIPNTQPINVQDVFHTELEKWIKILNYSINGTLVSFSEVDEYLVLYQSEEDENAEELWARPIQMFFEHVEENNKWVRRFNAID